MVVIQIPKKEIRQNESIEIREVGENKETHIQGYALLFNSLSEDLGYREIIEKEALDKANLENIVLNINHDNSKVLARNTKAKGVGSLKISIDDKGLFFDAIPTDTSYARDLIENMKAGVLNECSFAFRVDYNDEDAETWSWAEKKDEYDLRIIKKIDEIYDVSIVTNGAYSDTSSQVYKRNKEEVLEKRKEFRKRKIIMELELLNK